MNLGLDKFSSLDQFKQGINTSSSPKEVTVDKQAAQQYWEEYVDTCESQQLRVMLDQSQISFSPSGAKILVPSDLAKSRLLDEKSFIESLRLKMGSNSFKVAIKVDQSRAEVVKEEDKIPVTTKEKLEYLKKLNPHLDLLIEKLKLKIKE